MLTIGSGIGTRLDSPDFFSVASTTTTSFAITIGSLVNSTLPNTASPDCLWSNPALSASLRGRLFVCHHAGTWDCLEVKKGTTPAESEEPALLYHLRAQQALKFTLMSVYLRRHTARIFANYEQAFCRL